MRAATRARAARLCARTATPRAGCSPWPTPPLCSPVPLRASPWFRPVEGGCSEEELEQYIALHIRPLEERVRAALLSGSARRAAPRDAPLPPEKRRRSAAPPGAEPPALQQARSYHL